MALQNQQTADEILAHALAAGRTIATSAKAAGISESTAYRRLREPGFQTRVAELRAVLVGTINGLITTETFEAYRALSRLLGTGSEATQIRAAKTVIELALKFNDRDRRAGLLGPDAIPQDTTEPPLPAAQKTEVVGPEQPAATPPGLSDRSGPVAPAAGPGVVAGATPEPHDPIIAAEVSGPPARNLSKPVTDCHGPAGGRPRPTRNGRPPFLLVENGSGKEGRSYLDQTDRLSAGLTAALERIGSA